MSDEINESENYSSEDKLAKWDNPPKISDLLADFNLAKSSHDTQVTKIDTWLDNLNITGKARRERVKGRSNIQPKLIRKQAEWRYAALSEPFLGVDKLFTIDPITYEDKPRAIQNEVLLNNQFNTVINKVHFVDNFIRTAVNEGTVIVRVGWENQEIEQEVEVPQYSFRLASTPEELMGVQKLIQLSQEDANTFANTAKEHQKRVVQLAQEQGRAYVAYVSGSVTETQTITLVDRPTVEICDYNNIFPDPTCEGDFSKAKFVIHSFETSMAELKSSGLYSNLDKIVNNLASPFSVPDHATSIPYGNFDDKPRERFVAYEYWGYWDINGDGTVSPIVATYVNTTIIRLEDNPFPDGKIPFVCVPYLPVRRSIYGEPDGELLKDNQDILGALSRGMIDIMGRSAAGQKGMRKDALDSVNRKKYADGKDYEFNPMGDPRSAVIDHVYPELPASAQFMYTLQNNEAEGLTGVRAFSGGISGEGMGDVATGIRGALDAASKRELGILRRLSQGMTEIARKVIGMNAAFLSQEQVVRITNEEFVTINPDDLDGKFDLSVSITTAEEDNLKAQELAFMLQTMGNSMDFNLTKIILSEIARLRKMPVLSKRIEEFNPQPDPLEQQKAMLEIELLKAQIAKVQSEVVENQTQAQLNMGKAGSEQIKAGNVQADTDRKNLDFIEQESGVTQARDLEKQGAQARANMGLEVVKATLAKATKPNTSV